MNQDQNQLDALQSALLQKTFKEGEKVIVRAEDIENESSGLDFTKHFFEPKAGNTYLLKLLPNPGGEPVTHRSLYKRLPDPTRRGKTFHYTSSGNSRTCQALELFFELNDAKKNGDVVAEKKIDKYLGRTNQACVKVQILQSPNREEIGMIRLFTFASFGPNATVAQMIDKKVNLTKEKLAQGFTPEDVFNIFGSSAISLDVREATYDGVKGRDYTNSEWTPTKRGAIAIIPGEDGQPDKTYEFKETDLVDGKLNPEVQEYFNAFVKQISNPDYDVYNYFAYKEIGDPRNTKETEEYLKMVQEKVDEIIPIIREKSLTEIAAFGKAVPNSSTGKTQNVGKSVLAESIPDELAGSIMEADQQSPSAEQTKPEEKSVDTSNTEISEDDILNS